MENNNSEGTNAQSCQTAVSDSYIVFKHDVDELVQLSVPLATLEQARTYVDCWKGRKLYIYKFVE